ncbi:hypothetical protein K1W54_08610 [Micromonospora sp. CPCC 205371]|nr:hypothetical protein [Micromonospora sp. CPCC 205371]
MVNRLGAAVALIVDTLRREREAVDDGLDPAVPTDPDTVVASAAEKIVTLAADLRHANQAGDRIGFWLDHAAIVGYLSYMRIFQVTTAPHLPTGMADELEELLSRAEDEAMLP